MRGCFHMVCFCGGLDNVRLVQIDQWSKAEQLWNLAIQRLGRSELLALKSVNVRVLTPWDRSSFDHSRERIPDNDEETLESTMATKTVDAPPTGNL